MPRGVVLSIIIVHYKTRRLTFRCLETVYRYAPECDFEVILLDNGSEDNIREKVLREYPRVRFIEVGQNIGFAKANNLGMHNARGDFLLLLNSDTEFIGPSLEEMVRHMASYPGIGAIGPKHIDGANRFQLSCGKFPTLVSEIFRKVWHYHLSINDYHIRDYLDQKYSNNEQVDWLSGSCLLLRREALQQAGLLDETFFMYFEDVDLCRRISDKGWGIHLLADTSIVHHGGESVKINLLQSLIEYRKSQIHFGRKYYGRSGDMAIRLFLFLKYGVNLLKWAVIYLFHRTTGRAHVQSYTYMLLSKKVMLLVFQPFNEETPISRLEKKVTGFDEGTWIETSVTESGDLSTLRVSDFTNP